MANTLFSAAGWRSSQMRSLEIVHETVFNFPSVSAPLNAIAHELLTVHLLAFLPLPRLVALSASRSCKSLDIWRFPLSSQVRISKFLVWKREEPWQPQVQPPLSTVTKGVTAFVSRFVCFNVKQTESYWEYCATPTCTLHILFYLANDSFRGGVLTCNWNIHSCVMQFVAVIPIFKDNGTH